MAVRTPPKRLVTPSGGLEASPGGRELCQGPSPRVEDPLKGFGDIGRDPPKEAGTLTMGLGTSPGRWGHQWGPPKEAGDPHKGLEASPGGWGHRWGPPQGGWGYL